MKVRLNKRTVDQAVYQGPGGCYLWDIEMPGFGLRIYPSGRKSFVVSFSLHGRRRFFTLGAVALMTPAKARTQALEIFARVRKGEDPSDERLAASSAPRMSDLADRHIREHAQIQNKPRSVERSRRIWDRYVLPKLGKRRVRDIQRADIAQLMTSMAETKSMANKVLTLLSKAESKLIPAEIFRNIVGSSSRSESEAWAAARKAGLDKDIRRLPMGMHTYVSEGGEGFSGGQKQRLLIARALVNEPRIVFLDEATSALDNKTQAIVTQSLREMQATRIVIAHRMSTIRDADRIYCLYGGRVVGQGTYESLVKEGGLFAELAKRQDLE